MKKIFALLILFASLLLVVFSVSGCSDTSSADHKHTYDKWTVITEPTCTEGGVEKGVCECGSETERKTEALGHSEGTIKKWITETDEAHPENSVKKLLCKKCDEVIRTEPLYPDLKPAQGLIYERVGTSYEVADIGDCKDSEIIIPSTYNGLPVTSIGRFAFYQCYSIKRLVIPDTVTTIREGAFIRCTGLVEIFIPDSVTVIEQNAFIECTLLGKIKLPSNITYIGYQTFAGCIALSSVEIPDSVTLIEESAFESCDGLRRVTFPENLLSIGNLAFGGCDKLLSVELPGRVEKIGDQAFYLCDILSNVVLPSSVTSVGHQAFAYCEKLYYITYQGTKAQWSAVNVDRNNAGGTFRDAPVIRCTDGDSVY